MHVAFISLENLLEVSGNFSRLHLRPGRQHRGTHPAHRPSLTGEAPQDKWGCPGPLKITLALVALEADWGSLRVFFLLQIKRRFRFQGHE